MLQRCCTEELFLGGDFNKNKRLISRFIALVGCWKASNKTILSAVHSQHHQRVKQFYEGFGGRDDQITEFSWFKDNQNYTTMISNRKTQLADLLGLKTQWTLIRSHFVSIEQMEHHLNFFSVFRGKQTKLFFFFFLHALHPETWYILRSHAEIRERAFKFYENLYKNELGAGWGSESAFLKDWIRGGQCRVVRNFKSRGVAYGLTRHGFWKSAWQSSSWILYIFGTEVEVDLLQVLIDSFDLRQVASE